MRLRPPADVVRIVRTLEAQGHAAWTVGGAVRDALLGLRPGDWDLATAAHPRQVQRIFRHTVPVGVEHGTVGVLGRDGRMYEVTTFRRDVETFGRHAVVAFADTLEEDLQRRDFTINAVAWHPLTGELRDPHGGAEDLRAGVLRTVGDPVERFAEDRLRVLRALRFAGRFHLEIAPRTWAAVQAAVPTLPELSAERVREELFKTLGGVAHASTTLDLYAQAGALRDWYPELEAWRNRTDETTDEPLWPRLLRTMDAVPRSRPVLRLAALLHGLGDAEPAYTLLRRLKCSNAITDRVVHLVVQHGSLPAPGATDADLRRWLRRVGRDYVTDLLRLRIAVCRASGDAAAGDALLQSIQRIRAVLHAHPPLDVRDLAIGGRELREMGIRPGPRYGEILNALLDRVTDEPHLNTREALLSLVERDLPAEEEPVQR